MPSSRSHSSQRNPFADSSHRNPFEDPSSDSGLSSSDARFVLPRRSSSVHHLEQPSGGSHNHDHDPHGPRGSNAQLRAPLPTHPPRQRRPEHDFEVDDSRVEPRAERTSRSRRAVNWWNRRVLRSHALTWLALILILVRRVKPSELARKG